METNHTEPILVGAKKCLEIIFSDPESRPAERTFRDWQRKGLIPFHRIGGRKVFFDPEQVRRALDRNFEVKAQTLTEKPRPLEIQLRRGLLLIRQQQTTYLDRVSTS